MCVCVSFIITVSVTMQYAELYLSLAIYSHFGFYKEDSASEIVPMTEQSVNLKNKCVYMCTSQNHAFIMEKGALSSNLIGLLPMLLR